MIYQPAIRLQMELRRVLGLECGVSGPDSAGKFTVTYPPGATSGQIAQGDSIASTWPTTVYRERHQTDIYSDVRNLTAAQKGNIQGDLYSGTPMKVLLDPGPNAAAISALLTTRQCSFATQVADRAVIDNNVFALYSQDNPLYLTQPPWDSTINVAAWEPVP
jgi:hypothetical protein